MKLQPCNQPSEPSYPRGALRACGRAALGLAAVGHLMAAAGEIEELEEIVKGKPKADEQDEDGAAVEGRLKKIIARLAGKLGADAFEVRQTATLSLVKLGKGEGQKEAEKKLVRALVLTRMKELKAADDPEVAQRARQVIKALQPPQKPPPQRHPQMLLGDIAVPQ